jgi:hypothetical protein
MDLQNSLSKIKGIPIGKYKTWTTKPIELRKLYHGRFYKYMFVNLR